MREYISLGCEVYLVQWLTPRWWQRGAWLMPRVRTLWASYVVLPYGERHGLE